MLHGIYTLSRAHSVFCWLLSLPYLGVFYVFCVSAFSIHQLDYGLLLWYQRTADLLHRDSASGHVFVFLFVLFCSLLNFCPLDTALHLFFGCSYRGYGPGISCSQVVRNDIPPRVIKCRFSAYLYCGAYIFLQLISHVETLFCFAGLVIACHMSGKRANVLT